MNMAEEQIKAEQRKLRFSFSWRQFWIYGVIWILINAVFLGIWKTGTFAVREAVRIRTLIEWQQRFRRDEPGPRRNGRDRVGPFRRNRERTRCIEDWIDENLPECERSEQESAARAFRETALMLRSGNLTGTRDSFAELTARIQPEIDRETWYPFLEELSVQLLDELPENPDAEEIAEIFERAAETVSPKLRSGISDLFQTAVPVSSAGGNAAEPGKSESEPVEKKGESEKKPANTCGAGTACPGGICYRYR